jgi:hypothetical protein
MSQKPGSLQSDRLDFLIARKEAFERRISIEKNRLRSKSRRRASIRARLIGEVVVHLAEQGRIGEIVRDQIGDALRARVEVGSEEWDALEDTGFALRVPVANPFPPAEDAEPSN